MTKAQEGKPHRANAFEASAWVLSNILLVKAIHLATAKVKGRGTTLLPRRLGEGISYPFLITYLFNHRTFGLCCLYHVATSDLLLTDVQVPKD